eukprot:403364654
MDWARLESSDDQDYDGEDESGSNNEDEGKTIKQKDQDIQGNLERSYNGLNSNAINQQQEFTRQFQEDQQIMIDQLQENALKYRSMQQDSSALYVQEMGNTSQSFVLNNPQQQQHSRNVKPPKPNLIQFKSKQEFSDHNNSGSDFGKNPKKESSLTRNKGHIKNQRGQFANKKIRSSAASEESALTNPNSLYRKMYNKNLKFFLWVIENEQPPYIFKMHVQAHSSNDINTQLIQQAIKTQFTKVVGHDVIKSIDVRSFPQKNQFKIFIEIEDKQDAQKYFKKIFKQPKLTFYNELGVKLFDREMRAYLIKDEGTFEKLALLKYQEDGNKSGGQSKGTPSSIGSYQKQGRGSINNSSDESTAPRRGGSGSQRGSGRGKQINDRSRQQQFDENSRNNSADENIFESHKSKCLTQDSEEEKLEGICQNEKITTNQYIGIPKPPKTRKKQKSMIFESSPIKQLNNLDEFLHQIMGCQTQLAVEQQLPQLNLNDQLFQDEALLSYKIDGEVSQSVAQIQSTIIAVEVVEQDQKIVAGQEFNKMSNQNASGVIHKPPRSPNHPAKKLKYQVKQENEELNQKFQDFKLNLQSEGNVFQQSSNIKEQEDTLKQIQEDKIQNSQQQVKEHPSSMRKVSYNQAIEDQYFQPKNLPQPSQFNQPRFQARKVEYNKEKEEQLMIEQNKKQYQQNQQKPIYQKKQNSFNVKSLMPQNYQSNDHQQSNLQSLDQNPVNETVRQHPKDLKKGNLKTPRGPTSQNNSNRLVYYNNYQQ